MKPGEPAGDYRVVDVGEIDPKVMPNPEEWDGQWGNRTAHMEGCTNEVPLLTFRERVSIRFVLYTAMAVYYTKRFFKKIFKKES
jgi:hypothetical protein